MAKQLPSLGELEMAVMRAVWQEQPCTERQVWQRVRESRDVGRTTVLKTMQRLEAKQLLTRVAGEGPVHYRATVGEGLLLPVLVRKFVSGTLAGSPEALVNYLADSEKLSAKDLAALRAIARKMAGDGKKNKS